MTDKVACRTPAEGRDGVTNVPRWKYDMVREHILDMVRDTGEDGMLFSQMKYELLHRMSEDEAAKLGSPGWHVTTVKLNMEVEGELQRMSVSGPQRIILG